MTSSNRLSLYAVSALGLLAIVAMLWTPAGSAGAFTARRGKAEASPSLARAAPEPAPIAQRPAAVPPAASAPTQEPAPAAVVLELEPDPNGVNGAEAQGGPAQDREPPPYDDSTRDSFERAFEAESVDAPWAAHEEQRLRALLESGSGFQGVTAHCRSTACRVEVAGARHALPPRGIATLMALATKAGASAAVYREVDSDGERLGAFVLRE